MGKCCSSATTNVARGYSADEARTILFQMRRSGYAKVMQALQGMGAQNVDPASTVALL